MCALPIRFCLVLRNHLKQFEDYFGCNGFFLRGDPMFFTPCVGVAVLDLALLPSSGNVSWLFSSYLTFGLFSFSYAVVFSSCWASGTVHSYLGSGVFSTLCVPVWPWAGRHEFFFPPALASLIPARVCLPQNDSAWPC